MTNGEMTARRAKHGDRIEVTIKGIVEWASDNYVQIKPAEGKSITLDNADLDAAGVVVKSAMPKWQDGDVVLGYDGAYAMEGVFRRRAGKWFNEHVKGDPHDFDDPWIEEGVDKAGFRILVAEGRPVLPEPKDEVPHGYVHGGIDDDGRCLHSDANGACGMPEADPIHHGGK